MISLEHYIELIDDLKLYLMTYDDYSELRDNLRGLIKEMEEVVESKNEIADGTS